MFKHDRCQVKLSQVCTEVVNYLRDRGGAANCFSEPADLLYKLRASSFSLMHDMVPSELLRQCITDEFRFKHIFWRLFFTVGHYRRLLETN